MDWSGPGAESSRLDHAIVMPDSGDEALATMERKPIDPDTFVYDEEKAAVGRKLFVSLGCASCHDRSEGGRRIQSQVRSTDLAALDAKKGCLGEVRPSVPNFELTGIQTDAIAAALEDLNVSPRAATAPEKLTHAMSVSNCYACHRRGDLGGPESDRNARFISTIPEMGDEGRLPPPLDGVGDKLRGQWIKEVVGGGNKSRPYMQTHMPGFGAKAGDYFSQAFGDADRLTEAEFAETRRSRKPSRLDGTKTRRLERLGLRQCHTFGKFKSSGIQAIALDTMAKRIRRDWFHRYLPDPQKYRPGTRMPTGYPEGKSTVTNIYEGDRDRQLAAMWAFLEKGTGGGVPEGITGGMIELKPSEKPILYRNFIEGVSPRGIAVGYPEAVNLCWDAESMSLALIWQDRFIDASKHWKGRGPGKQSPLGGNVIAFEKQSPVAVLASESVGWPKEPARQRGYRFLGYRLDKQGARRSGIDLPSRSSKTSPSRLPAS